MQGPSGFPPGTPAPPATPAIAGAAGTNTYTITIPQTQQDLDALRERRSELSNQLESAASRRAEIVKEMQTADGAVKAGLVQRMSVLDQRILQLENDIAMTGRELTSAPAGMIAASQDPFREMVPPHLIEKVSIMFTLFVLAPLAIGAAYLMFKRAGRAPAARVESGEGGERMQRLESAVDAIAVEIERISEGQRFVTRLLTEPSSQPALGLRQAQRGRIGTSSESE